MKNFIKKKRLSTPLSLAIIAAISLSFEACDEKESSILATGPSPASLEVTPGSVARMLSEIPLSLDQVEEVWDAVTASAANGFDEEYTFRDMFDTPGKGVGDERVGTRSPREYSSPLSASLSDYINEDKHAAPEADILRDLTASGLQIYWPYSEDWDGRSMPVITYIPDLVLEANTGFLRETLPDGSSIVKEILVDEDFARSNPVWVVNWNEDASAITPQILEKTLSEFVPTRASSDFKTLRLKEFKAHVQYDPWYSGGSEFFVKCGSLKAFTASVVSDLSNYTPEITDLMIKVKRKQVGTALRYNTTLVSEWSSQLTDCAFLIHEDDGGKMTSWKASGEVKIKSKSYGFGVEFPYHRNDDIVWRGKLSSNFLEKNNGVANRFGDVSVTFIFN